MSSKRGKDLDDLSDRQVKRLMSKFIDAAATKSPKTKSNSKYARGQQVAATLNESDQTCGSSLPKQNILCGASGPLPKPKPPCSSPPLKPPCSPPRPEPPCSPPISPVPPIYEADLWLTALFDSDEIFSDPACDEVPDEHFIEACLDNDVNFEDYLLTCDDCHRCSLCSCFLACGKCKHECSESCVHCDECSNDWLSLHPQFEDGFNTGEEDLAGTSQQSSEGDTETEVSLREALGKWAVDHQKNVKHGLLKDLLAILRKYHPEDGLPSDPRTLLGTARIVKIREMSPGHYWHCGITHQLQQFYNGSEGDDIKLTIGFDGLPISGSSGSTLWPILCSFGDGQVVIAGVYHGYAKPDCSNDYLKELSEEVAELVTNGVYINNKHHSCRFHCCICDAVAKAFGLRFKGHTGYFSCLRCLQKGKMFGRRMAFPNLDFVERTDESFRNREQPEHHLDGDLSVMLSIPGLGPVSQFVHDPMHMLYLGVMKKLLLLLIVGPLNVRMGNGNIKEISDMLIKIASYIPSEFSRKCRSLVWVRRFKATEFRLILLYLGPVILRKLRLDIYQNFLCLHFAVRILNCPTTCHEFNAYAASLMKTFVCNFKKIYGEQYVSHNIHGCLHIHSDVLRYGYLESFSAFQFENFMQKLKALIRKGNQPLQQIAKRYSEAIALKGQSRVKSQGREFLGEHNKGPRVSGCGYPQYTVLMLNGFKINVMHKADCCVKLKNGCIVEVKNFAYGVERNAVAVVGSKYLHCEDLYSYPCSSSTLGIAKVHGLSPLRCWPSEEISCKMIRLPYNETKFAVFPFSSSDCL